VTELRLLESAEHTGEEYPGEEGNSGFEEERCLLGNDTMLIGLMPPKRPKTFTSPHDVVSHKT
jgi:hypothetical protein